MHLRLMSSSSAETSTSRANESSVRNSTSHNSLNCFVVNHQNLSNGHKAHRKPGLPRGNSRASTGNLVAVGQGDNVKQKPCTECSNVLPMTRSSSATNGIPQPEWLDKWSVHQLVAPETATVPLSKVLRKPASARESTEPVSNGANPLSPTVRSTRSAPNSRASTPVPGLPHEIQPSTAFQNGDAGSEESPPRQDSEWRIQKRREVQGPEANGDASTKFDRLPEGTTAPETGHGGVPVFVMMPLDTVTADGKFRHTNTRWFHHALDALVQSGVHGIAVDVWWGAVERQPQEYDWAGYRQLFELAKAKKLKVQAVLSFHACGGNVGDSAQIPLPQWVLEAGERDVSLFFKDKPRPSREGLINREYISFWADEAPRVLCGRSPLECYTDYMREFRNAFVNDIGDVIEEIIVGSGPCGELRYASYPETNGWRFPGVGEFQCYDKRAMASLAECAQRAGHPEWGQTGPHDAGEYISTPDETGFFRNWEGSWDTPYGRFFLSWYSSSLLQHGERLLQAARSVFNFRVSARRLSQGDSEAREKPTGTPPRPAKSKSLEDLLDSMNAFRRSAARNQGGANGEASSDIPSMTPTSSTSSMMTQSNNTSYENLDEGVSNASNGLGNQPRLRRAAQGYDGKSISLADLESADRSNQPPDSTRSEESERWRGRRQDESGKGKAVGITLKVAGVHWWFRTNAHAAELTAGYFNAGDRDGYRDIIKLCAKYGATFTLTCVEMCDSQHPPETLCGPEGLLRQVKEVAAELGVEIGGENALPCFFPMHIDDAGLDRIVYNAQAWVSPLQGAAAQEEAFNLRTDSTGPPPSPVQALPDAKSLGFQKDPRAFKSGKLLASHLPRMRGLTFLRLTQEMMTPPYQGAWLRFMQRMQNIGNKPDLY